MLLLEFCMLIFKDEKVVKRESQLIYYGDNFGVLEHVGCDRVCVYFTI